MAYTEIRDTNRMELRRNREAAVPRVAQAIVSHSWIGCLSIQSFTGRTPHSDSVWYVIRHA